MHREPSGGIRLYRCQADKGVLMPLKPLNDNIRTWDGDVVQFYGFAYTTRMRVIRPGKIATTTKEMI